MTTRPTKSTEWGTGAIPSGPVYTLPQAQAGWPVGYQPPAQWLTEWQNAVYQWLSYLDSNMTSTATAGGTTTLTAASDEVQVFTGTLNQSVLLPDGATIPAGRAFKVFNFSTGTITVKNSSGTTLFAMPPPIGTGRVGYARVVLMTTGTPGGWGYHYLLPGQLPGTVTSDFASVGNVGELISHQVVSTGISLTSGTTADLDTWSMITLTPGDWNVSAMIAFSATGTVTKFEAGVATASATMPTSFHDSVPNEGVIGQVMAHRTLSGVTGGADESIVIPAYPVRVTSGATLPLGLVVRATFSTGSCSAWGTIWARRAR